ncbi:DUF4932 domain-containing protein [Arachidicoccus terrestris]|uniref:DUF4932 domain-containing protein n=1 Tax=Arachidicoccus terrestris TaxID=2875539 RepID=UPI001CC37252|nr:DUF4932 domain-containing protein [Arachidicoccus terrestris]UAY57008.1 DUF4932 domain-containing protein [Arachidicoccus terrestris]
MASRICLLLFLLNVSVSAFTQQRIHSKVDKRMETLSIVARLAGYEEYNDDYAKKYVADIHQYFDPYKEDTLFRFMRFVRAQKDISLDAVSSMAVCLQLYGGKFSLIDSWKTDLGRWDQAHAIRFVSLLNAFYTKTKFDDFFKNEQPYYDQITVRYDSMISNLNQSWYFKYYGTKRPRHFNIIIGCANGGQNYGAETNSKEGGKQLYAIQGSWTFDTLGKPVFPADKYFPTIVHEFNHTFINPILGKFEDNDTLKNSAASLFNLVKSFMVADNYGMWQIMVNESLVRASVVRYLIDNHATGSVIDAEMTQQEEEGFLWIRPLVALLGKYEKHRDIYPTFEAFYPKIIHFFDTTATSINSKCPEVTAIVPSVDTKQDVDPRLKTMTLYFDRPMDVYHYSFHYGKPGKAGFPVTKVIGYSKDGKSIEIGLDLQPDTEYEMVLRGSKTFKSADGYPLKSRTVRFRTAGQ